MKHLGTLAQDSPAGIAPVVASVAAAGFYLHAGESMGWQIWLQLALLLLRGVISKGKESPDCPGGICEDAEQRLDAVQSATTAPSAASLLDFFNCVSLAEWFNLGRRWFVLIRDAMTCGSPIKDLRSFLDCLDITAAVELAKDTIELIAKAMQCDGGEVTNPDAPVPQ